MDQPTAAAAVIESAAPATAPAPAVAASPAAPDAASKKGFLASLLGSGARIAELEAALASEQSAHAAAILERDAALSRVAEFEEMEASLEQEAAAAAEAAATATAAAAEVPQVVAAQVRDVVASLGVDEEKLAPVQETPPAKSEEFSHLSGRERAAAAFNAQFATA